MKSYKKIIVLVFFVVIVLITFYILCSKNFASINSNEQSVINEDLTENSVPGIDESIELKFKKIYDNMEDNNKKIATINNKDIFQSDYDFYKFYHHVKDEQSFDEFILNEIILQDAEKNNLEITKEEQKYIENLIEEYKNNKSELEKIGISDTEKYINTIKKELEKCDLVVEYKGKIIEEIRKRNF